MRQAETEWRLLTNGRKFQILKLGPVSRSSEEVVPSEILLDELKDEWEVMRILSKDMIQSGESYELAEQLNTKKKGIEKLEANKEGIRDGIAEYLIEQTDESLSREIKEKVNTFIEDLIQSLDTDPSSDELPRTPEEILNIVGTSLPGRSDEIRHKRAEIALSTYTFLQNQGSAKNGEIEQH